MLHYSTFHAIEQMEARRKPGLHSAAEADRDSFVWLASQIIVDHGSQVVREARDGRRPLSAEAIRASTPPCANSGWLEL